MSTFLTAEWRKLIMAQYAIEPALLAPYLPHGLELDLYQGRCYVSLVAFLFDKVRIKRVAIPCHTRFEEINLRFYVKHTQPDGSIRRGVVFIREFVPRQAIATVAQRLYEEPYTAIPTQHSIALTPKALTVSYAWQLGGRTHSVSAIASPIPQPILPNTEEDFITEHYWGYTKRRPIEGQPRTSAYEVEHPRWQTYNIESCTIDADFALLYGPSFAFLNHQQPNSVLLAEGSAVAVLSGHDLHLQSPSNV